MKTYGRGLEVKVWMADKIAGELRRNINRCDVFAILKETEKAIYAVLDCGQDVRKTTWIPKSALDLKPECYAQYEPLQDVTYEEAMKQLESHWDMFR